MICPRCYKPVHAGIIKAGDCRCPEEDVEVFDVKDFRPTPPRTRYVERVHRKPSDRYDDED